MFGHLACALNLHDHQPVNGPVAVWDLAPVASGAGVAERVILIHAIVCRRCQSPKDSRYARLTVPQRR